MSYGVQIFNESENLVLDAPDRTGQIVTSITFSAAGSSNSSTTQTTTQNLPTSFNTVGVNSDSEISIIAGSNVRAYLQDNGVGTSPRWSVKAVKRGTGSATVTCIVISFGDTA